MQTTPVPNEPVPRQMPKLGQRGYWSSVGFFDRNVRLGERRSAETHRGDKDGVCPLRFFQGRGVCVGQRIVLGLVLVRGWWY